MDSLKDELQDELKDELKAAFEAPEPLRKREFFQNIEPCRMSMFDFIVSQLGYIRKWTWGIDFIVFSISLTGSVFLSAGMLWTISALTPLLALVVVVESGRSEQCMMTELELATRFSLRSVILARLTILGFGNAVLLGFLIFFGLRNNVVSPLQGGLYVVTPFLLTTLIGLNVVRRFRGRESVYLCTGVSVFVSVAFLLVHAGLPQLFEGAYLIWWIAGAFSLCIGTLKQCRTIIKSTEELVWSF